MGKTNKTPFESSGPSNVMNGRGGGAAEGGLPFLYLNDPFPKKLRMSLAKH